ncbi:MAG: DegT/DnrJ/EryC1/StrS family aminotransferase [Lachnospiraceae bacterium]|nr:DegT/DnrJ/EryC1/StrS family aminotransferase [Lachnospiraceae bacterium]
MNTPIYDFVRKYKEAHISRLHMPGHKGQAFLGCEDMDITEIKGADVLSMADGIIKESQENAASLFGAGATFYSTEGSSQCIKAMLETVRHDYVNMTSKKKNSCGNDLSGCDGEKEVCRPRIIAARNVHRAMIDACALIDIDIDFLMPGSSSSICSGMIKGKMLDKKLSSYTTMPMGVYITSPDYLGNIADIKEISSVCDKYDIPLIVDNAHGAYLAFMEDNIHPMNLGAAICCDSAHKTLPVLTGGAYVHISERYKERYTGYMSKALTLFGSTSPSYLIMQSLDICNAYLAGDYRDKLLETVKKVDKTKKMLRNKSVSVIDSEKLKIVIDAAASGYTGEMIAEEMRNYGIECEYADRQFIVLMFSTENSDTDFERVVNWADKSVLTNNAKKKIVYKDIYPEKIKKSMTIREAVFSPSEMIDVSEALGRVCAAETISCPPAVPIAVSGEVIDRQMIDLFTSYGIEKVCVVAGVTVQTQA